MIIFFLYLYLRSIEISDRICGRTETLNPTAPSGRGREGEMGQARGEVKRRQTRRLSPCPNLGTSMTGSRLWKIQMLASIIFRLTNADGHVKIYKKG
jgi:hypothetical protein